MESLDITVFLLKLIHINDDRNGDVVLNALIAEFITLGVKHHMTGKVLETQDFYEFPLCSNTIVSTCLSLSKLKFISCSMIGNLNLMDFSHCPLGWRSS